MKDVTIPEGWEVCAWADAIHVWSPVLNRIIECGHDNGGIVLYIPGQGGTPPLTNHNLVFLGVTPVRRVTPKPVVIKVDSFFDAGHTYHNFDAKADDFPAGTQFIEVTPEVFAALAKGGIEVGS